MRPVDTAMLAVYLDTTPREVRRQVAARALIPIGRGRVGRYGQPTWWFDLDDLYGQLDKQPEPADSDQY
jgi:hypothetical protein